MTLILFLVGMLVAGCGSSSFMIGWREISGLKHKRADYVTFDGV
jgi:hypothetical protein